MSLPRAWFFILLLGACGGACGSRETSPTTTTPAVVTADASGSGSGAPTEPIADPNAIVPGQPAPLDEKMAQPYFTTGDAGEAARVFALEKWAEALPLFEKARATAKGADVPRLELLLGLTEAALDHWSSAVKHFEAARAGLPVLADYVTYQLARAKYFAHDVPGALALAKEVSPDSVQGADAELLVGDALRATKDWAGVLAHYQDYLARRPNGARKSEVRFRIAEAIENTNGDAAVRTEVLRRITIEDPLSSWRTKAHEQLTKLGPQPPFTAAEHIEQGMELFDAMRNPESEAAFTAALAVAGITPEEKCTAAYHAAQSRFKARDRTASSQMFDVSAAACKEAKNTDLEIKSLYQAGRAYAFIKKHDVATERYQAAQKVDPEHSYSDDALLREAEEWTSRGDAKKVEATLSSLPTKFPKGDNIAEAMWRLGWQAWKKNQTDAAIKWWTKQVELVPHDDNYYGEGQAQYWLGRAYAVKGKQDKALDSWEAGVKAYPMAYYAMLGLNRIRETDAKRYAKVLADIQAPPAGFDPSAPTFTFKPRVEYSEPGFARALELLRLGLGDTAGKELSKLGLSAPKGKSRVEDADLVEKLWAMAYLFDRAGRYEISHWPTRWHILDYRREWPVGANDARWKIAYPLGYGELLKKYAAQHGQPFALQIAIVREESAFDPLLESYANAIGLTQLVKVAADRFAKGTGVTPDRESLRDPEKNVIIGSNFLGYLYGYWKQFILLVPPSYNGGEGYVRRALKARGTQASDEWIEGILDDQIRNYSKRVLGTYFTYTWLYAPGTVPEMPNAIPTELIPTK